ncbi:3'-5' exoribonuclease [Salmonella enterica]|nr:3'-5' exoribonuclease [Salmonella enterica subsp. enterica]ECC9711540.1 3'-5' exoribonuclease [Salmonella enterica subsp. enterica]EGT9586806.1 3'-5' exoribonuclease [Salmonella enterica]ELL2241672.1 3'-5' exoribonuclease [Salmonella enterica]
MSNVMIDIETAGTGHHSAIISYGVAVFDLLTGKIIAEEYIRADWKEDCMFCGGKIDPDTVEWWMKQSSEARAELINHEETVEWWMKQSSEARAELINHEEMLPPDEALMRLFEFIRKHCDDGPVYVWAKSPSFDLLLIKDAVERCAISSEEIPWKFWNEAMSGPLRGLPLSSISRCLMEKQM